MKIIYSMSVYNRWAKVVIPMQSQRYWHKSKSQMETQKYILFIMQERNNWKSEPYFLLWLLVGKKTKKFPLFQSMKFFTNGSQGNRYTYQDCWKKTSQIGCLIISICHSAHVNCGSVFMFCCHQLWIKYIYSLNN